MKSITLTTLRGNISSVIAKICKTHELVIMTRQKNESVIMMPLEDCNSIEETFIFNLKALKILSD